MAVSSAASHPQLAQEPGSTDMLPFSCGATGEPVPRARQHSTNRPAETDHATLSVSVLSGCPPIHTCGYILAARCHARTQVHICVPKVLTALHCAALFTTPLPGTYFSLTMAVMLEYLPPSMGIITAFSPAPSLVPEKPSHTFLSSINLGQRQGEPS